MLIHSPHNLHYPITVGNLAINPRQPVERTQVLFSYTYETKKTITDSSGEETQVTRTYPADFRAEIDGTLLVWQISKGDVITHPGVPIVDIDEPCRHEVQFAGMCTSCGKDMTTVDFVTTVTNDKRATINMVHGNRNLTVSQGEAVRANTAATSRLLSARKLSLVVDLDQTIIHAVCDPTVGDWQKDESNPNYEAVRDVQSFELQEDIQQNRACSYYIKMRPGLPEFLENMSKLYELHIYTMGTRSYAESVARIVDPERRFFGDRILSRDESGSMTRKSLYRIFPVDTKMVVIIDDRGDVWRYSANLVRVRAFNFFVGIGDINSSFLPKQPDMENLIAAPEATAAATAAATPTAVATVTASQEAPSEAESDDSIDILATRLETNDQTLLEKQKTERQEEIASQLESRPLLREQEKLDHQETQGESSEPRHSLLQDDDIELSYLDNILQNVHQTFYSTYDQHIRTTSGGNGAIVAPEQQRRFVDDHSLIPDITELMPAMKTPVLAGVVICFTGVIPQGMVHETSDIGMWAQSFGARVSPNLTTATTHVVADKNRRTVKVREAAAHSNIKIVDRYWLLDCFSAWQRADEDPYLIEIAEGDVLPNKLILEEEPLGSGSEPGSPFDALNEVNWDDMDDDPDMDDTGDDDDSEMEADIAREEAIINERKRQMSDHGSDEEAGEDPINPRKRRLTDSGNEDDVVAAANGIERPRSRLEQRKKRAMERTTSLSQVSNIEDSAHENGLKKNGSITSAPALEEDNDEEDEDENDDDEIEFEKQMLLAFADDD